MIEHWQRSEVTGTGENIKATEVVLHQRGQDALGMAMRRNSRMPACDRISIITEEAFVLNREDGTRRTRDEIPRDDRQGEELEW